MALPAAAYRLLVPIQVPAVSAGYTGRFYEPPLVQLEGGMEGERVVRKGVVFLGYEDDEKRFVPRGTGFVVSCPTKGRRFFHVVTAEHVITHISLNLGKPVVMRFNREMEDGGTAVFPAPVSDWYYHPDPDCTDVAVLPAHIDRAEIVFAHSPIEKIAATQEILDEYEVSAGDEVFIAGLFTNHYGKERNIPIIRTGHLAAMPEEPVKTRYKGYIDAYLVEARSIGGLSGSPVFIKRPPISYRGGKVQITGEGMMFYLLGMMQGHFDIDSDRMDAVAEEDSAAGSINTGIGVVIPVQKIIETVNQPDLLRQREEIVEKLERESPGAASDVVDEDLSDEEKRDRALANMLNTPPAAHKELKERK